jgi:Zn-dependent alcohol dehydrogenase
VAIALGMSPDGTTRLRRQGNVVFRGLGLAAMADFVVVPASAAVAIPHDVPLDLACVIGCAVQTGVGAAIYSGNVRPGDSVLVLGAGGIGMSILAGAKAAGATRLIMSDPIAERRELALEFGATDLVDPTVVDVVSVAHQLTGVGVDVAFDAVGSAALVEACMQATRSGGTTVMVGAPGAEETAAVGVAGAMFTQKRLVGSLLGGCHAPRDFPMLIDLWRRGALPLEKMVTARRPLEEVNEAVADMVAGRGIRTVLRINAD